ncbi:MAG: RAD55 family ATPase [Haloferacaceae archaeon]
MTYELGVDLPSGAPPRVQRGTNLLVTGPPMVGKQRLALELLAAGQRRGEGGLLVTTETPNARVAEAYAGLADDAGPPLRIVDAVGEGGGREVNDRYAVEFVSSPGDLTGLGIAMNKAFDAFVAEGTDGVRVALDSLSTMLTYLDAERVFKFLHVLTGRVSSVGGLGVYTLNTAAADPQAVGMLKNTVDGVVHLDDGEGGHVDGFDGVTG